MALTLPSNFKKDIQGKDTFLIPLVVILDRVSTANDINISTNSINISHKADPNNTDKFIITYKVSEKVSIYNMGEFYSLQDKTFYKAKIGINWRF